MSFVRVESVTAVVCWSASGTGADRTTTYFSSYAMRVLWVSGRFE